jgi:hypothetical protein
MVGCLLMVRLCAFMLAVVMLVGVFVVVFWGFGGDLL